jgi:hypothetical protein
MSRNLIISACWADGEPDDLTADLAERVKGFRAEDSRGSVVSFAPATVDAEFLLILRKLDLAEVADAHPDRGKAQR